MSEAKIKTSMEHVAALLGLKLWSTGKYSTGWYFVELETREIYDEMIFETPTERDAYIQRLSNLY